MHLTSPTHTKPIWFIALLSASTILLLLAVLLVALLMQPTANAQVATPPPVSAERLEQHVRYLSETTYPRSFDQKAKLDAAAAYIKTTLEQAGILLQEQSFTVHDRSYKNLIMRFGPETGPRIVVGAHYDSHGIEGASSSPSTHTPGADDNASGVAGLIELALLLKHNPPKQAIELIAYTLEEPPNFRTETMGSAVHVRSLIKEGTKVSLMISLEMIGYFSDQAHSQRYPVAALNQLYPNTGNFIAIIGRLADTQQTRQVKSLFAGAVDVPVYSLNAPPAMPGVDFSDHLNFWAEDIPALMITDTAFYRNPHYHRAGDTADTLDYQRMAQVVRGVYAVLQGALD